jgi:twitching motility protein PilT
MIKQDGEWRPTEHDVLTPNLTRRLMYAMMDEKKQRNFEERKDLDFSFSLSGHGRFRVNCFQQRGSVGGVMRTISEEVISFDTLGVPKEMTEIARLPRGLVLITGPTGSGKSTTLATMIDMINGESQKHIVTVEDPIEFFHSAPALDRQPARDRRGHARLPRRAALGAAAGARRHPGRRDARLRDDRRGGDRGRDRPPGVRHAAHELRARGHRPDHRRLPRGPAGAGAHPAGQQPAGDLHPAAGAARLRRGPGAGLRAPDRHPGVRNQIREGKTHMIPASMQVSGNLGMITMDACLAELHLKRVISFETGLARSVDAKEYERLISSGGVAAGTENRDGRGPGDGEPSRRRRHQPPRRRHAAAIGRTGRG